MDLNKVFSYSLDGYSFEYCIKKDYFDNLSVTICGYNGKASLVSVPEFIIHAGVNIPVKEIEKKVFLGNKYIREIKLPFGLSSIGNYAFAQCGMLDTVVFYYNESQQINNTINFGKGVFEGSNNITDICVGSDKKNAFSALLAALPNRLDADYLLNGINMTTSDWIDKWDNLLLERLAYDDGDEMSLMSWGEEDLIQNRNDVISESIMKKISLCMLRLLNDVELKDYTADVLKKYVLDYNIGCRNEESWKYIVKYHGDDMRYFKLLDDIGGINSDNIDRMLATLDDELTEAKAFILKLNNSNNTKENYFNQLIL